MKLERYEVHFSDEYYEPYESDVNGDWVRWDEELQEAWDKSQKMKLKIDYFTEKCHCNNCNMFVCHICNITLVKYCSNCGQKLTYK